MLRFDEQSEAVSVFRQPADYTNGNTVDRQGRLVSCQHGLRRVVRTEHDGSITVLADRFEGKRFNSPNDVVVKSDDSIWFTDPSYGIDSNYEGFQAPSELGERRVYRIDPRSGGVTRSSPTASRSPNGLAFSVDERRLYIVDTGTGGAASCASFDVARRRAQRRRRLRRPAPTACYDGLRIDVNDRIWTSAGEAVHCHERDGTLLGRIVLPERVSNLDVRRPETQPPVHHRDVIAVLRAGSRQRREDSLSGAGREKQGKLSTAAGMRLPAPIL